MAWQTPKTDWATDDVIGTADLNRIEGDISDIRFSAAINGRMGVANLTGASLVVNNTSVTANTRIFLTIQNGYSSGLNSLYVSDITPGVSFKINLYTPGPSDPVNVAYLLLEPQ
jgi:hypothetical protein